MSQLKSLRKATLSFLLILMVVPLVTRAVDLPKLPEQMLPALGPVLKDAVKQSPRMLLRRLDLDVARGDLIQAKAGLYPSVGGSYQYSKTRDTRADIPGVLPTDKVYYSLSLNQPVFYWGERRNNARMGEIRSKMAAKQYAEGYRMLALEIRGDYLQLVLYKVELANARFAKSLADQALKAGLDRVAKKSMAEGEIFGLRTNTEQAALNVATLESAFAFSKQTYASVTGQPEPQDEQIPDLIPVVYYSKETIDHMLAGFLSQDEPATPAMEIMRQQIDVATLDYANQRKRLLPKLSFVMGISQDQQSYTINIAQKYSLLSRYAGLQVNWSIFDGFATRGAIASTLARKRQAEESYRQSEDDLKRNAQNAARAVDLAYQQMAINDRLLANNLNYLNFRRDDFKRGQASEADVNQALSGYNSSLVSANVSRSNFLMSSAEFVSLVAQDPVLANLQ